MLAKRESTSSRASSLLSSLSPQEEEEEEEEEAEKADKGGSDVDVPADSFDALWTASLRMYSR